jgi:hypothetical protein
MGRGEHLSTTGVLRGRAALAMLLLSVTPLLAVGCGGGGKRTSNLRPPKPINIAVKIGDDAVDVSPRRFGAGPIVVQASNQSSASHRMTLEGPRVKQTLGPINPLDTATLKVNVTPGEYVLSADGSAGVKPAKLTVGPKRPSAQNDLLLP